MILALLIGGCGDDPAAEAPAPDPTPAATQPALPPKPIEPPQLDSVSIAVADEVYLLPPMVLRFWPRPDESGADLLLSGHEKAEPTGHTLVLSMAVDAQDIGQLHQTAWTYLAPSDEWTDTTQGLTLSEGRFVLRPYDVTVRFTPVDGVVKINITGRFLRFDTRANPELPGKPMPVEAAFDAALVVE